MYGPCAEGVVLSNSYKETWNRSQETWVRLPLNLTNLGLSLTCEWKSWSWICIWLYWTKTPGWRELDWIWMVRSDCYLFLYTHLYTEMEHTHSYTHAHIIHSQVLCKFETCWMAASRNTSGHFQCLPLQQPELSHLHLLICQLVQVKTIHTMFHNCSEETLPKNLPSVSDDLSG